MFHSHGYIQIINRLDGRKGNTEDTRTQKWKKKKPHLSAFSFLFPSLMTVALVRRGINHRLFSSTRINSSHGVTLSQMSTRRRARWSPRARAQGQSR